MIEKNNNEISIKRQSELLEINRSSLYYKPVSETEVNLEIMRFLDKQFFLTPFYGHRKLTILLRQNGFNVNKKRVRRLMKIMDWRTIYREPRTTIPDKEHKKYPYLLRNLEINRNNQVWATDITYVPMAKGFMYLMAIIDVKSRYVLKWSISNTMTAEWCAEVLTETLDKYGNPEPRRAQRS